MSFKISIESLSEQNCTTDVATILPQVWQRSNARLLHLNHPSTVKMTLWTLLRWERKLAHAALDVLGVDTWELEKRLDALLEQCNHLSFKSKEQLDEDISHAIREATDTIREMVICARGEAEKMHHNYIGSEHILIAVIRMADTALSALFRDFNVNYDRTKEAIITVLTS